MSDERVPSDSESQAGTDATPTDVAKLHSWADLRGAKYRDFSGSRAQTRERQEKSRLRGQQGTVDERQRAREEAEARLAEAAKRAEPSTLAEEVKRAADKAARMVEQATAHHEVWNQPLWDRFAPVMLANAPVLSPRSSQKEERMTAESEPKTHRQGARQTEDGPGRKSGGEAPAWLTQEPAEMPSQSTVPHAPEDTLQGSRDRLTSRWFALKGVFDAAAPPPEVAPTPMPGRAPVLAVFSLAGGVGKTSLVATLGRALSSRGERVLLVDTASYGLLPFYFGARDQRPGVLRTFSPPVENGDAAVQMMTIDPETVGPENAAEETVTGEIQKHSRGSSRVIVDLATASVSTTRRVMRLGPLVLIPVVPDLSSVVSVSAIDTFVQHNSAAGSKASLPYYVLNQFDPSMPLHLDVREVLREQLGDRLLPFALRRTPAMSEALAEGMTVMDYAPNSLVAEDIGNLAGWLKSVSPAAAGGSRGIRWSEK